MEEWETSRMRGNNIFAMRAEEVSDKFIHEIGVQKLGMMYLLSS